MSFRFVPATRDNVKLLIAIAGASGSGKTFSALRVARGLAGGDDSKIYVIDTEAGRAKHYAIPPGEKPTATTFGFQHGDLGPPFTPEHYADAIDAAVEAGAEVVVIDSFSHEWEGEGGLHDIHDAILAEQVEDARKRHKSEYGPFDPDRTAERLNIGAWRKPKERHKKLVNKLLQCRAHLIICLRADEKLRIEKVKDGKYTKTVIVQPKDMPPEERWVPICEKRFMYEMTLSVIVSAEKPGEPIYIKVQEQHRAAIQAEQKLSERTGELLAEWSGGGGAATEGPGEGTPGPMADDGFTAWADKVDGVIDITRSSKELKDWWNADTQRESRTEYGERAKPYHRRMLERIRELEKVGR